MKNKYSYQNFNKENMAKVLGKDLSISTKTSTEVAKFLKNRTIKKAKEILNQVINKKLAIPYTRFNQEIPHRRGNLASGRYPVKVSKQFLNLINSVESNAQNIGLNTDNLIIKHIIAHKASRPIHAGRIRGIKMKRTHVEIIAEEKEPKKKLKKANTKPETKEKSQTGDKK